MRFIVDGYNVSMGDDATRRLSRDDQRDALVRRVSVRGADLLGAGPVTIVFDGHHGEGVDGASANVDVRYSRGESADDVIVGIASGTDGPLTVVTSDRELRDRVRQVAGDDVRFLGCSALFEGGRPKRRAPRGRFPASTAGLPKGANRITEELKAIWLDEEE